jgi:hypothetical protein
MFAVAGFALVAGIAGAGARASPDTAQGNDSALDTWSDATGADAPTLITTEHGTTQLVWTGAASLDLYARDATGGELLTPFASGAFYALGVQGDWRGEPQEGERSWAQITTTLSNDPALLPGTAQLASFQAGHATRDWRLTVGDVSVLHSNLGTSTSLRGWNMRQRSEAGSLSVAAGVISPSWESLADPAQRTQPLRNAVAFRVGKPLTANAVAFGTLQAFDDSSPVGSDVAVSDAAVPLPASGHSATLGLNLRRGRFTLQTEVGASRLKEQDATYEPGAAMLIDAAWHLPAILLRAGHRDFSSDFATLSTTALPGLRETYGNAAWSITPTTTVSLDLRDMLDRNAGEIPPPPGDPLAIPTTQPARTRAVTLQATTAPARLPGASLTLAASRSLGVNPDGGRNNLHSMSASAAYTRAQWNATLGYQLSRAETGPMPATNSTLHGVSAALAREHANLLPGWHLSTLLRTQLQQQDIEGGAGSRLAGIELRLQLRNEPWGSVALTGSLAHGRDSSGAKLQQHALRIDAERPLDKRAALRVYAAHNDNFPDMPQIAYSETVAGAQINYRF